MKTRNKAGNLLLAFVLALTLHVAFAIDVSADDWGDDRALHVAVDSAGAYLFTFSGTLTEGDEYISEDNILYRIVTVTDGRAVAERIGEEEMPDVSWLDVGASQAVFAGEEALPAAADAKNEGDSGDEKKLIAMYVTHSDESSYARKISIKACTGAKHP